MNFWGRDRCFFGVGIRDFGAFIGLLLLELRDVLGGVFGFFFILVYVCGVGRGLV